MAIIKISKSCLRLCCVSLFLNCAQFPFHFWFESLRNCYWTYKPISGNRTRIKASSRAWQRHRQNAATRAKGEEKKKTCNPFDFNFNFQRNGCKCLEHAIAKRVIMDVSISLAQSVSKQIQHTNWMGGLCRIERNVSNNRIKINLRAS